MECIIVLLLIVPLPVLWLVAHAILYPTVIAAQKVQGPFRFQLLDFVALILQIQLVLGAIMALAGGSEVVAQRNLFLAVGLGASVALWLAAVRFLSKAGITQGRRRAIFILIYLPGTLAVLIIGPIVLLALLLMLPHDWPIWRQPPMRMGGLIGILFLTAAAGLGLRKLGEWLVK